MRGSQLKESEIHNDVLKRESSKDHILQMNINDPLWKNTAWITKV